MAEDLKPGQKHPTPTPGFGDRVFYETLLRQRPDSEMAQEWCVAYGVLPEDEAQKYYKKVLKRKGKGASASAASSSKSSSAPAKKKKKAKVVKEEGADPDMQVSGAQAVGRSVI
ncbi:expressed unknown protein [Seminavis robusta]|uniref:Uncharacterized protein n=1 Tax=Seminavis robusta TaxID=568900 RepID=A0A9N8HIJ6_9STRA|nr:expressed unknown protein [Seminavis robusta]|eukprot:Sro599_g173270.1 n/a (114) ;mRNA; r:36286-36774